jgi:hypothetical protein
LFQLGWLKKMTSVLRWPWAMLGFLSFLLLVWVDMPKGQAQDSTSFEIIDADVRQALSHVSTSSGAVRIRTQQGNVYDLPLAPPSGLLAYSFNQLSLSERVQFQERRLVLLSKIIMSMDGPLKLNGFVVAKGNKVVSAVTKVLDPVGIFRFNSEVNESIIADNPRLLGQLMTRQLVDIIDAQLWSNSKIVGQQDEVILSGFTGPVFTLATLIPEKFRQRHEKFRQWYREKLGRKPGEGSWLFPAPVPGQAGYALKIGFSLNIGYNFTNQEMFYEFLLERGNAPIQLTKVPSVNFGWGLEWGIGLQTRHAPKAGQTQKGVRLFSPAFFPGVLGTNGEDLLLVMSNLGSKTLPFPPPLDMGAPFAYEMAIDRILMFRGSTKRLQLNPAAATQRYIDGRVNHIVTGLKYHEQKSKEWLARKKREREYQGRVRVPRRAPNCRALLEAR